MSSRLKTYTEKIVILYPVQLGFRFGHSTDLALVNIQEVITKAVDENKFSVGLFLDLVKAFDTVDHEIKKLHYYGIREVEYRSFVFSTLYQRFAKCVENIKIHSLRR